METYSLQLLVWQADTVLHLHFIAHTTLLSNDCDTLNLDTVFDNARAVGCDWRWGAFNSSPRANFATPSDNGVEDAGVMFNLDIFQNDRFFDTYAGSNVRSWPNRHIRAKLCSRIYIAVGWMNTGGKM